MAVGKKFQDVNDPHVFIRVGDPGQKGLVEISDIIITGKGSLPGAVYMEWNMRELADDQGSAAMWEVLFRIGGALGINVTPYLQFLTSG
jgi:glucan 1,3-beta-glucosidase